MKKNLLLLGSIVSGSYAALIFIVWLMIIIGSLFSANIRNNFLNMLLSLTDSGFVGWLVILQVLISPIIATWISSFLFKKYKSLK